MELSAPAPLEPLLAVSYRPLVAVLVRNLLAWPNERTRNFAAHAGMTQPTMATYWAAAAAITSP